MPDTKKKINIIILAGLIGITLVGCASKKNDDWLHPSGTVQMPDRPIGTFNTEQQNQTNTDNATAETSRLDSIPPETASNQVSEQSPLGTQIQNTETGFGAGFDEDFVNALQEELGLGLLNSDFQTETQGQQSQATSEVSDENKIVVYDVYFHQPGEPETSFVDSQSFYNCKEIPSVHPGSKFDTELGEYYVIGSKDSDVLGFFGDHIGIQQGQNIDMDEAAQYVSKQWLSDEYDFVRVIPYIAVPKQIYQQTYAPSLKYGKEIQEHKSNIEMLIARGATPHEAVYTVIFPGGTLNKDGTITQIAQPVSQYQIDDETYFVNDHNPYAWTSIISDNCFKDSGIVVQTSAGNKMVIGTFSSDTLSQYSIEYDDGKILVHMPCKAISLDDFVSVTKSKSEG